MNDLHEHETEGTRTMANGEDRATDEEQRLTIGAEAYVSLMGRMAPESIGGVPSLVTPDIHFKDPFNDFTGVDRFVRMVERMFRMLDDVELEIRDWARLGRLVYMSWTMRARPRRLGRLAPRLSIDGMSRIELDREGRVREHVDYWDSGVQLLSKIPLLNLPFRLVERFV